MKLLPLVFVASLAAASPLFSLPRRSANETCTSTLAACDITGWEMHLPCHDGELYWIGAFNSSDACAKHCAGDRWCRTYSVGEGTCRHYKRAMNETMLRLPSGRNGTFAFFDRCCAGPPTFNSSSTVNSEPKSLTTPLCDARPLNSHLTATSQGVSSSSTSGVESYLGIQTPEPYRPASHLVLATFTRGERRPQTSSAPLGNAPKPTFTSIPEYHTAPAPPAGDGKKHHGHGHGHGNGNNHVALSKGAPSSPAAAPQSTPAPYPTPVSPSQHSPGHPEINTPEPGYYPSSSAPIPFSTFTSSYGNTTSTFSRQPPYPTGGGFSLSSSSSVAWSNSSMTASPTHSLTTSIGAFGGKETPITPRDALYFARRAHRM